MNIQHSGELMVRFVVVILQFLFFTRACAIVRFGVTSSPSSVLFRSYHETAERALHSLTKDILRTKLIELPHDRPAFKVGELIEFDLFDGLIYYGDVTSFVMRNPTSACWFGNLHSSASLLHEIEGEFELSCDQKACVANLNVYSTGDEYIISPANNLPLTEEGAGIYQLSQYSREKKRSGLASQSAESFIIDHTSHLHEKASSLKKIQSSQVGTMAVDTDLILDCFVMYTPEALAKIGGSVAAMKSKIYLASDSSNNILERSGVSLRLRVVGIESAPAGFVEPNTGNGGNDFSTLLSWLQNPGDGNLDSAHVYRELYGADLVLLVNKANAYAGLGYVNIGYNANYAMANYNVDYVYGRVWMHEIGHILGCFHDRFSAALYSDPNYFGYGNCWEDTSKNDCTCYSSVMVYDCNTVPNGCTSCSSRDFLANKYIYDAGSPTGEELASCGLHIHEKRMLGIAYRETTQPGGILNSVVPSQVVNISCFTVVISGWQIGTGSDIISVTLDGISAEILSQTVDSVTVRSPITSHVSSHPGDVVVTTSAGRITSLLGVFSFISTTTDDKADFDEADLSSTSWESTGTLPWSFYPESDGYSLLKDGGSYPESAYAELTSNFLSSSDPEDGGCSSLPTSLSFAYWANSLYPQCYGPNYSYKAFSVWTRTSLSGSWTLLTTISGSSATSSTTYTTLSYSLPSGTVQVKFLAETCSVPSCANCRWWAPVRFESITVEQSISCTPPTVCLNTPTQSPTLSPSNAPSSLPSYFPTAAPAVSANPTHIPTWTPSVNPSYSPSTIPSANPTSTPSVHPSVIPSTIPSLIPTSHPTSRPTAPTTAPTLIPSIQPSTPTSSPSTSPSLEPTSPTASPSIPPSISPSSFPSISPSMSPTTSPPTNMPSLNPTFSPSTSPTSPSMSPSYLPSRLPTITVFPTTPTFEPTISPTLSPSFSPSTLPTTPSLSPSSDPTLAPTATPSTDPTLSPTATPSTDPTLSPTATPSTNPTLSPTVAPSADPTLAPTGTPSSETPSLLPSSSPSLSPSLVPTVNPTSTTDAPTFAPSIIPPLDPTLSPTRSPTFSPSSLPPAVAPTIHPTKSPSYIAPVVCSSGDRSFCNNRGYCSSDGTTCHCDDYLHYWPSEQCSIWHPGRELEAGQYCYPGEVDYYCSWLGVCNDAGSACNCYDPEHRSSSDRCSSWSPPLPPGSGDGNCVPGDRSHCNNRGYCNYVGVSCVCDDAMHYWASERCAYQHMGPQLEEGQCCSPGATDYYCAWMGLCNAAGTACECYDVDHRLPSERCQFWHQNISVLPPSSTLPPNVCPPDISQFTASPSFVPTFSPTTLPTISISPSFAPSLSPTSPTLLPTSIPSSSPTISPTKPPTMAPSFPPSHSPSANPTSSPTIPPTRFPTSNICVPGDRSFCNNRGYCDVSGKGCVCDDDLHFWPSEQCSIWHAGRELEAGQYCYPGEVDYYCSWLGVCNEAGSACNCYDPEHRSSSDRCSSWSPAEIVPDAGDGSCIPGDRGYCYNRGVCNSGGNGCACDDAMHYWSSERCEFSHYGPELSEGECCFPNETDYYCGWLGSCDSEGHQCTCFDPAHRLPSERCFIYHETLPDTEPILSDNCPALLDLSSDTDTRSSDSSSKSSKYPYAWPYWTGVGAFVIIFGFGFYIFRSRAVNSHSFMGRSYEMTNPTFTKTNHFDEEDGAIIVVSPHEPDRSSFHMLNPLEDISHL